jgi:hypothetical protein
MEEATMGTTQEKVVEAFIKLSDELKAMREGVLINESDIRLAYLHGMAFHENSMNLISAITFIDGIYQWIDENRVGVGDELFDRLTSLLMVAGAARIELHQFTDELRAEFDEYRKQPPLRKR